tara:strand:- start:2468 stop:2953 length:486 start_codon:yes stop_codon:yes gene_type:complete
MPLINPTPTHMVFEFTSPINESLQTGSSIGGDARGDVVYYCPTVAHGGFNTVNAANHPTTNLVRIGLARSITINASGNYELEVEIDTFVGTGYQTTVLDISNIVNGYKDFCKQDCFLMFSKNKEANRSSLLGYYAEVGFNNDSPDIAELFAVSTEVSESSK